MSRCESGYSSGRGGRAARLAVSSVFTGIVPALFLIMGTESPVRGILTFISVALLVLTLFLWVRLPFTGVSVECDHVVITSWWTRRRIERTDLTRFRVDSYSGPFYYLAWAIDDGPLESGELWAELRDGSQTRLRGTVCSRRVANEIARALNDWLGASSGIGTTLRSRVRQPPGAPRARRRGDGREVSRGSDPS